MSIDSLGKKFGEIWAKLWQFSFKMCLKMSFAKCQPICLDLNVLRCRCKHASPKEQQLLWWCFIQKGISLTPGNLQLRDPPPTTSDFLALMTSGHFSNFESSSVSCCIYKLLIHTFPLACNEVKPDRKAHNKIIHVIWHHKMGFRGMQSVERNPLFIFHFKFPWFITCWPQTLK